MLKIIRDIAFVIFVLIFLMSINKGYGLTAEEEARIDKELEFFEMLKEKESEVPQELGQEISEEITQENQDIREGVAKEEVVVESEPAIVEKRNSKEDNKPKRISLDIKGMDIVDVLKLLSTEGNLNIVTGKNVTGRVSMFLKDVDVWDAFEIIIAANGLAYERKANIVKVMNDRDYELAHGKKYDDKRILKTYKPRYIGAKDVSVALNQVKTALGKVVVDEASNTLILFDVPEQIETMEDIIEETDREAKILQTRIFELNYAESDKLKEQLQEILTKNVGVLKTDARTNKIVVVDYPSKIVQIEEMVKAFDAKTKQVLIEAKIIQVTLTDQYKMGIDWKFIASKHFNITAFNISRALDTQGAQVVGGAAVPTSSEDFKIIMDMLKTFGDTKTLSTPRITAINGQEAKILVGSKEVYVTSTVVASESTTTTSEEVQFVDVGVKLYVTPTINEDGFITMKIRPEVSSVSSTFTKQDGTTIPIVGTSEAETSVLIKDGVTIVMGGLMKNQNTKTVHKLPFLGDMPFLGALFRRTEDTVTKTELVIFLTPHIISGAESPLGEKI